MLITTHRLTGGFAAVPLGRSWQALHLCLGSRSSTWGATAFYHERRGVFGPLSLWECLAASVQT